MKKYDKKTINDLSTDYNDVWNFAYEHDTYVKSTDLRQKLNKMFNAKIVAAYGSGIININKESIDWSGTNIILVIDESFKIVRLTNSEWSLFSEIKV